MKIFIAFVFALILNLGFSQKNDTLQHHSTMNDNIVQSGLMTKAGSCGSPDGAMLEIAAMPPSWQWLSDEGYCFNGIPTTNDVTMCFTFTPTVSDVLLNAGYSETCNNNNFTVFNLYDNTCSLVSTSLNPTGLIPGQQYTWCVTMRAWGGPSCNGYTTFCPYWINNAPLPVELVSFEGDCISDNVLLEWTSLTEINNDYYTVERSDDATNWEEIAIIDGAGNSIDVNHYSYLDSNSKPGINYYRLKQTDFDGQNTYFKTIAVKCKTQEKVIESIYSITGEHMGTSLYNQADGIYIIKYTDNTTKKIHFTTRE